MIRSKAEAEKMTMSSLNLITFDKLITVNLDDSVLRQWLIEVRKINANVRALLKKVNDDLSKKHKLTIPEKQQRKKGSNYISQREVEVRKRGRSFKADLEEEIDRAIEKSNSYDIFFKNMKSNGYGITDGRFLWIEHKESKRLMSTKPLGIHYRKLSIKYRIENKDFEIVKNPYTIKNKHIDKSEEKYRENKRLRRWAAKNNIMHLLENSNLIINKKMSMEDIEKKILTEEEFYKSLEKSHSDITHKIDELEKRRDAFDVYKKYAWMFRDYKESDNPNEFKRAHFKQLTNHLMQKISVSFFIPLLV